MASAEPFPLVSENDLHSGDNEPLSWKATQKVVRNTQRLNIALASACRVPTNFNFRYVRGKEGSRTRLYFLAVPQNTSSRENTLMYVDILDLHSRSTQISASKAKWTQLLDIQGVYLHQERFSKEEQLLRERKRLGSFGITSYDVDLSNGRFVFPASNTLFTCHDTFECESDKRFQFAPSVSFTPVEVSKGKCTAIRLDTTLCPSNADIIAYISNKDLWVSHTPSGHDERLTFAHDVAKPFSENFQSAGVPPFVIQEEFDRYTGYWWQPESPDGVYRLLYEHVDERDVTVVNLVCPSSAGCEIENHRYPRSGEYNAVSFLKMVEFKIDETGKVIDVVHKTLDDAHNLVSGEYSVRAGWLPDSSGVWVQMLDRAQKKLDTFHIPVECFVSTASTDSGDASRLIQLNQHKATCIYTDISTIWVNVTDAIYFMKHNDGNCIEFITVSERTGFRHLYHVKSSLIPTELEDQVSPVIIEEVQLTAGDWEVMGKEMWVDEERKIVYFMALKDTPLESHLYAVSLGNPQNVVRLTEPDFSHVIYMDAECSLFVSVYSSISRPPRCDVFRINHQENSVSNTTLICNIMEPASISHIKDYVTPSLFNYTSPSSGLVMHGMIFKPADWLKGKKFPTVLYVYGGPQVQIISNAFKGMRYLRLQTMASMGYLVVAIDSRGSCNRGLEFEAWIRNRLGQVEINDQVEGLLWLAAETNSIDLNRVAIYGSSYGGYLSLQGLIQRPDIFKLAIAGAPVTSWDLYDTGYTERYMDLPSRNQSGYEQGSVISHAYKFPDEPGRLLINHGLMDENVHFYHTSSLIDALIKNGKPYQLQVYPNERHGIRNLDASEHYETLTLFTLQQSLRTPHVAPPTPQHVAPPTSTSLANEEDYDIIDTDSSD